MLSKLLILSVLIISACSGNLVNSQTTNLNNLTNAAPNNNQTNSQDEVPAKKTQLTLSDRIKWKAIIKWDDSCPTEEKDSVDYNGGLKFYELSAKKYLVEVKCSTTNYLGYKLYFLYNENVTPSLINTLSFTFYRGKDDKLVTDPKNLTEKQLNERSRKLPSKIFALKETDIFNKTVFDNERKALIIYDAIDFPHNCGTLNKYDFVNEQANLYEIRGNWLCYGEETDPLKWKELNLKKLEKIAEKQ